MNFEFRDLLSIEDGVICHQVNSLGVMGAGLASKISLKWPKVFLDYKYWTLTEECLGHCKLLLAQKKLYVANLCGQNRIGRNRSELYTNYLALYSAIREARYQILHQELDMKKVYFPEGMGCGLGGGKWPVVLEMISELFPDSTICSYGGG